MADDHLDPVGDQLFAAATACSASQQIVGEHELHGFAEQAATGR